MRFILSIILVLAVSSCQAQDQTKPKETKCNDVPSEVITVNDPGDLTKIIEGISYHVEGPNWKLDLMYCSYLGYSIHMENGEQPEKILIQEGEFLEAIYIIYQLTEKE